MHHVSANYTLPTVLSSVKAPQIKGVVKARDTGSTASTGSTTSTSSSSANDPTSAASIQSTFLNLLATELQNQDPTAPVDSTAMVGQMISLNQLDQLININQTLGTTATSTAASGAPQSPANAAAAVTPGTLSPSTTAPTPNTLPFDPNTMMPLASGNTGAVAASLNSSLNAAMLGSSSTHNNTSGDN